MKFFKIVIVCLLVLPIPLAYAQTNDGPLSALEDSVLKIISKQTVDTVKARYYNNLAFELRRNHPTQTVKYGTMGLEIYRQYFNVEGEAGSYLYIGTGYLNLSMHTQALAFFEKAIASGTKCGAKKIVSRAYNNTGIIYIKQGNNPEALKNYLMGLKIREEIGDKAEMGSSYANIGNVYFRQDNYDEALKNYRTAIQLFETTNAKFGLANALSNIGNVYTEIKKPDSAVVYFNESLKINEEINDKRGISSALTHLGDVNIGLG